MKFFFALAILLLVALSFYADYKWKQWVRTRQQARTEEHNSEGRQ